MEVINSLENKKIKLFASLKLKKYRQLYNLFLVEEKHMIQEALKANAIYCLLVRENVRNEFDCDYIQVSDAVMKKLSSNVSLNDYIAVCKIETKEASGNKFVILENIQDPGNMGTIIRTCYGLGYDVLYISNDSVDIYNEKCIQASQGAIFHLPIIKGEISNIIQELKAQNCHIIATDLKTNIYLSKANKYDKFALIFGNEGNGIKDETIKLADERVKIEMKCFDSLNVSVAAGICMYEYLNKK